MFANIEDPMIAWNLRNLDQTIFIIIFISLVILVGFLSRKSRALLSLTVAMTAVVFFLLLLTRNEYGLAF